LCARPGLQLALGENQLPKGAAHITLSCLDVSAGLHAAVDLFDRDSRYLTQRLFGELYGSRHGHKDVLTATLTAHFQLLSFRQRLVVAS
jgi:hypothetical protein